MPANQFTASYDINTARSDYRWFNFLRRYAGTYEVFNCPVMTQKGAAFGQIGAKTAVKSEAGGYPQPDIMIGYSGIGVSSNYAYAYKTMSATEDPTGSPTIAWAPRRYGKIRSLLSQSAGATTASAVVAMDGCYWIATDQVSTNGDTTLDAFRYLHPGNTASLLFIDGHVQPKHSGDIASTVVNEKGVPTYRLLYAKY